MDNNPFDTGKAIEALCAIAKIKLPDNFNPMEVDLCTYLKKIQKVLSKHKDIDLKNAASDIEALMKKICD